MQSVSEIVADLLGHEASDARVAEVTERIYRAVAEGSVEIRQPRQILVTDPDDIRRLEELRVRLDRDIEES